MNPFMALADFFSITFVSFIVICGLMNVSSLVGIFITSGVTGAIDQEPLESRSGQVPPQYRQTDKDAA